MPVVRVAQKLADVSESVRVAVLVLESKGHASWGPRHATVKVTA